MTESKEKHQCAGRVIYDSWGHTAYCSIPASHFEGGKWWCGTHVPSRVAAGRAKRAAAYKERQTERERGYAQAAENARRLVLYPRLLAAAEAAQAALAPAGTFKYAADRASAIGEAYNLLKAIIAEAKGEEKP